MNKRYRAGTKKKSGFASIEGSPWFVPVVFLVLLLATVILFSDFIFSDQMLYGSDTLQSGFSFRSFYVDYFLEHGSVPQWTPHKFGGMPYIEAFHGDIFYPGSILKFFMPLKRALGWTLILHIFLSGVFMYQAARQFKLSKIPALIAGASYMFAAYIVSMVAPGHDGKIFVATLFPLMILYLDRGFEKKPFLNFTLLGGVVGLILLTPHPQMSYFSLWALSFYAAYKLISMWFESKAIIPLIKPASMVTYAVMLGLLISAIQMYPGINYTGEFSPRSDTKKGWDWATSWAMHQEEGMSVIIPEFSGTSTKKAETYYWGKNAFKDNSESAGTVPLFLGLLGLFFAKRRERWFFGGLALFAFVYALGATTPIFHIFYWLIPKVSSLRAPSMIMFLFSFSIAMLAGMGIQQIIDDSKEKKDRYTKKRETDKFNYLLFGFPAFLFMMALFFSIAGRSMISLWSFLFYSDLSNIMISQGVSKFDVALMNLSAIQSGCWFAFLFTGLAALFIWMYRTGHAGVSIFLVLLFIPVIDGIRFDSRFIDLVDNNRFNQQFKPNALTNYLVQLKEKFRVLNVTQPKDNTLPFFGIDVVVGYHGNQLKWYDDLLGGPGLTHIRSFNPRFLNLAGTKYMISPGDFKIPQGYFGDKPTSTVADFGKMKLIRNDNAFPRVYLVDSFLVYPERAEIKDIVLKSNIDLRQIALLEERPTLEIKHDTAISIQTDSTWIKSYENERVVVGVKTETNKLLVLADNYFDAWNATVDGEEAKILRVYGSFRAVEIPTGSQEVVFGFYSPRYQSAKMVTYGTLVYLLLAFGWIWYSGKKENELTEKTENDESEV